MEEENLNANSEGKSEKARSAPLAARMKEYEDKTDTRLDPNLPFVIRLDGNSFSTFTRGFHKPFDPVLSDAMIATTIDLVEKFGARTGFTASDEISLVFAKPENEKATPIFSGRVVKISTLTAGFCSARFNYHLARLCPPEHPRRERCTSGTAFFDARIFSLPDGVEVFNNIFWRSSYDTIRNSKSMFGQSLIHHKHLQGLTGNQIIEKVRSELGKNWEDLDGHSKWGSIVKKERFKKTAKHPKTGEDIEVMRFTTVAKSIHFERYSPENEHIIMRKYWNEDSNIEAEEVKDEKEEEER
eukprot:TRINITY_DN9613_c0_g1_i1.p1 TRINITY_DN9613_c0_g1~~TRINITY_DN9613_c0_g1_i1.p1  ORF type:complete len:324 (-),score=119.17 TRINITY_DN9613_c0_g1_i1:29-925(-)